ncbi:MAG TPA: hypothetical protein VF677_05740 [Flavobacterium sp.]|jgi:hypothetical protein
MKTGVQLISQERDRQIQQEGYHITKDSKYQEGELLDASVAYIRQDDRAWPWHQDTFKLTPHDRIRELVKAGALIAAEIDRLQFEINKSISDMKTKEELFRIYSAYLPYDLEVELKRDSFPKRTGIAKLTPALLSSINYGVTTIKPLLYPLSMLTKPIEHNGDKFVPIEKINEMAESVTCYSLGFYDDYIKHLPYWIIEKLLEWHFNVFGLDESLFIDKSTI